MGKSLGDAIKNVANVFCHVPSASPLNGFDNGRSDKEASSPREKSMLIKDEFTTIFF